MPHAEALGFSGNPEIPVKRTHRLCHCASSKLSVRSGVAEIVSIPSAVSMPLLYFERGTSMHDGCGHL
jgi:hypothetical protein